MKTKVRKKTSYLSKGISEFEQTCTFFYIFSSFRFNYAVLLFDDSVLTFTCHPWGSFQSMKLNREKSKHILIRMISAWIALTCLLVSLGAKPCYLGRRRALC